MACLLKAPTSGAKGVVVFTTQERDNAIATDAAVRARLEGLKQRWLIGLHHNWHDHSFDYDPLFAFSLAGEDDLRERSGKEVPLIPLDACTFAPPFFAPGGGLPFWDLLYIARAVSFKRLPEFLRCIRTLYDRGHDYRVLLISPMPPYRRSDRPSVFYELRQVYESMFSLEQQGRFTLLDLSFRYPFPFDRETLAHFYRSSRAFVHFADDERRCRVAGYAWASGLPVVGMSVVGSLLPASERRPPAFYEVRSFEEFPDRIVEALERPATGEPLDARRFVSADETVPVFVAHLERLLGVEPGAADRATMALDGLDIRLGRHHGLGGGGPNTVPLDVDQLVELLETDEERVGAAIAGSADPELALAGAVPAPGARRHRLRRAFA
jgi:glycosyltransferase involved in cell wall biosynthesis